MAAPTLPELPSLFLFSDEPVANHLEDALQLQGFSRTIAAAAIGSPGPFTIGLFAGWGLGKTSILRQAQSLIDKSPNTSHAVTAWVNAWRFEQEEHPLVPIILSILDAIYKKLDGANPAAPQERFLARTHRALRAIIYGFGFRGKIAIPEVAELEASASLKEMINRYENLAPTPDPLVEKSLYYHAYEILDGVLEDKAFKKPPFPKIVVFIDDLDRCLPDKALKVFESIKLVLSQKGFVFVLAVDREVIDAFLTKRYRSEFGLSENHHHGEQYMDKIIQLALHVPHHEGRFEAYIKNLICHPEAEAPGTEGKHLKSSERDIFSSLIKPLAAGTARNPRSLIRILNRLLTDKFLWDQLPLETRIGKNIRDSNELLKFAAISRIIEQAIGASYYRDLVRNQPLCKFITHFLEEHGTDRIQSKNRDYLTTEQRPLSVIEQQVFERIESNSALREMLLSESGKSWLNLKDKRSSVESFLDKTRYEDLDQDPATLGSEAIDLEFAGQYDEAELKYRSAISLDPTNAYILGNYASFLEVKREDFELAETFYQRAIQANEKDPNNLGNYADFLWKHGNEEEAEKLFKLTLKYNPRHSNNRANYGQMLLGQGKFTSGLRQLRRAWTPRISDEDAGNTAEFSYALWIGTLLCGQEEEIWLQAFKYLINEDFERHPWNFDKILDQAKLKISMSDYQFAKSLANAFLDSKQVPALDHFDRWTKLNTVDPLDIDSDGTNFTEII